MAQYHVVYPWEVFEGHLGSCKDIWGHFGDILGHLGDVFGHFGALVGL